MIRGRVGGVGGVGAVVMVALFATACGSSRGTALGELRLPSAALTVPSGPVPSDNSSGLNDVDCGEFNQRNEAYRGVLVDGLLIRLRDDAGVTHASGYEPGVIEMQLTARMIDRVTTGCAQNPSMNLAAFVSGVVHQSPDVYLR